MWITHSFAVLLLQFSQLTNILAVTYTSPNNGNKATDTNTWSHCGVIVYACGKFIYYRGTYLLGIQLVKHIMFRVAKGSYTS